MLLAFCVCFFFFVFIYFSLCSSFIKLVLFRSLAWFSISLIYLNLHKCNSLLYINPRLYKHLLHLLIFNKAQCHFLVYFKVGGAWFSISLIYLNLHKCNSLLYINPRLYKHLLHLLIFNKAQCHFLVYFKVGGGQLESLCYFDHHTHFILFVLYLFLSCNYLL